MTTLVFGIGIGLFAILTLWLSAALIFTVSLRIDKKIGAIAVALVAIITLILVSVPRSSENPTSHQDKPYDHLFIWRMILLIILAGSSLLSIFAYVKYELMEYKFFLTTAKMLRNIRNIIKLSMRNITLQSRNNKKFEISDNTEFVEKVMNSSVPVIVNFHAEWCDPCKILTPKLEELISPMENLHLAIIDVEQNPEFVHTFEVKAVPAIIAVSNGLIVYKYIGLIDAKNIDNLIEKLTLPKSDPTDKES